MKMKSSSIKKLSLFLLVFIFSAFAIISFADDNSDFEGKNIKSLERHYNAISQRNTRAYRAYGYGEEDGSDSGYGEKNTNIVLTDMTSLSKEDLVQRIMGSDVQILDVRYTGKEYSAGAFTAVNSSIIGFEQGIALSTGSIKNIPGPNYESGVTESNDLPGDSQLDKLIPGYKTNDATILEFDFIPTNNMLSFEYVFSSDEYNEYVGSEFNDVFGFFVNGKNVALIPNTGTVVSINSVNNGFGADYPDGNYNTNTENAKYYRDNTNGIIDTEMDGLTIVLTAVVNVDPNEKNTIRLAIADAGDMRLDSNVFIKAGSFSTESKSAVQFKDYNFYFNENEGAAIEVIRSGDISKEVSVKYTLAQGTAKSGKDYEDILTSQDGAGHILTFPAGSVRQIITIPIIDDSLAEEYETFNISLSDPSEGAFIGTIQRAKVFIKDNDASISDPSGKENSQPIAWDEMNNVSTNKNFRIDFSVPIDSATVTADSFYVTDEGGNKLTGVTPAIDNYDGMSVIMKAEGYPYEEGKTYYLHITKGVKSKSGKSLKNEIIMLFTTKDLTQ